MGGVSLELVALRNGEVGERSSLSIGPLRLMQLEKTKISAASDHIADELSRIDWLKARNFDTLYSVGGAWRAIARIHMRLKGHPLPVLHHFEMTSKEAAEVASLVAKQSSRSLGEIEGISTRRVDTLPLAAAAFREVLRRTKVERIIVSAGGLREGLLYSDLSEHERAKDPLFEGVRFLAERLAPDPAVGDAVISLTDGLFPDETPAQLRLRRAACLATDIAAYFQPDLRAMHAFDTALRGPLYGLSHAERVFMALALFCRHEGDMLDDLDKRLLGLMPWDDRRRAIQLGLALRFAGAFAPKAPAAFSGCALAIQGQRLEFRAPERLRGLMGEMPRRRLEALAVSFEATPAEVYY
jgi:exopolyphosphatase/guanosine-5'-triphosphate,3'-diphosphate pyrophosphatase